MTGMEKGVKAIFMRKEASWGHQHLFHPESKGRLPESVTEKKPVGQGCGGGQEAQSCGPSDIWSRCWTSFFQKHTCSFNEGLKRTVLPDSRGEALACVIILLCLPA